MSQPNSQPTNLITINVSLSTQLPIKLTSKNYSIWRPHINALLVGHDLLGFVDGTKPCPKETITTTDGKQEINPEFFYWKRQDQLLLHTIMAFTSEQAMSIIASATTSKEAWDKLIRAYANKSRSHILSLKERLANLQKGDKTVSEYLQILKTIADDLAIIHSPLDDLDLVIYALQGLGSDYREIAAAIRVRDTPITFEELHDKLVDHENFLMRQEHMQENLTMTANHVKKASHYPQYKSTSSGNHPNSRGNHHGQHYSSSNSTINSARVQPASSPRQNSGGKVICQLCDKPGHTAKNCYQIRPPVDIAANYVSTVKATNPDWLMDSGASQ